MEKVLVIWEKDGEEIFRAVVNSWDEADDLVDSMRDGSGKIFRCELIEG